jgi:drug/metabolite transporter (DMT)-like permease
MSREAQREAETGGAAHVALALLLGVLWGFNWPAVKIALGDIAPWTLRFIGMLLGGGVLAGLAVVRGRSLRVRRDHWLRLAAGGVLSIAAFNVLLAFAQLSAATSRAAIVTFTMPVWATLLARVVLGERFDRRRVWGLGLGIAGLAALGWPLLRAGQLPIGLLYALLGGVCWAAGTVLTKRCPVAAPPLTIAAWQLLIGAAAAGIGMLLFEGLPLPHPLGNATIVALVYHVLLAQALAYFLWFEIVARIPAGIASLGTLMVPAFGVLGAMLFLGERPTPTDYLGLVFIVAAAAAVLLPSSRGPQPLSGVRSC